MLLSDPIELRILENSGFDWLSFFAIIIPSIVSILGFLISTNTNKKNFNKELEKYKNTIAVEKGKEILELLIKIAPFNPNQKNQIDKKDLIRLQNNILAYGSLDLNKLFEEYQQINYKTSYNCTENLKSSGEFYEMFAYFFLMILQIKFDITNIALNPKIIARMFMTDYDDQLGFQIGLKNSVDKIVDKLDLNKAFKIEDTDYSD